MELEVNGERRTVEVDPSSPLLWVIRESLGLTGTKFGCGMAQCGACTVHIDGQATRSCVTPVSAAEGKKITTIEGLAGDSLHPVQQAWIDNAVPQCGYCQSGQTDPSGQATSAPRGRKLGERPTKKGHAATTWPFPWGKRPDFKRYR